MAWFLFFILTHSRYEGRKRLPFEFYTTCSPCSHHRGALFSAGKLLILSLSAPCHPTHTHARAFNKSPLSTIHRSSTMEMTAVREEKSAKSNKGSTKMTKWSEMGPFASKRDSDDGNAKRWMKAKMAKDCKVNLEMYQECLFRTQKTHKVR